MNLNIKLGNYFKAPIFSLANVDYVLVITVLIMLSISLVMIASSSLYYAQSIMGDELYFLKRQSIYLLLSIVLIAITVMIPVSLLYKIAPYFFIITVVMLIVVLLPGVGKKVNGSQRWIDFGIITFQVVEAVKVALILFVSSYLVRRGSELIEYWRGFIKPLVLMAVIAVLLLLQPDLGSVVVMVLMTMGLLFIAGMPLSRIILVGVVGCLLLYLAIIESPYRLQRLTSFWSPWEGNNEFGSSYQLTQSLIAYGQGEWFGVGLGNSLQKLFYLPEAHTDFIMPIVGEEFGFAGVIFILTLVSVLVFKCFAIGRQLLAGEMHYTGSARTEVIQSQSCFCGYVCFGAGLYFALHTIINVSMSMGLMPTKGLTLPFISYGGSSLLMASALLAVVIRIQQEFNVSMEQAGE